MSSAAPKKKSFDRGGPVWPPRSNVTNDRLRGGSGGALPPQPKTGGSGGQRPPAKIFRKIEKKSSRYMNLFSGAIFLDLPLKKVDANGLSGTQKEFAWIRLGFLADFISS